MWIAISVSEFCDLSATTRKAFEEKARVIEDLYNRLLFLRKVKIKGVKKIAISLTSNPDVYSIIEPIKGYTPVCAITASYDFHLFDSADDLKHYEALLQVIQLHLLKAAENFGWNVQSFKAIADEIVSLKYQHKYLTGRFKLSPDKTNKASIEVEMIPGAAIISTVFCRRKIETQQKVKLISVHPNRMFIVPLIGKTKWLTNSEFEVGDRTGQIHFVASIESGTAEIHFSPTTNTIDSLIDRVLMASTASGKDHVEQILKEKIDDLLKGSNQA